MTVVAARHFRFVFFTIAFTDMPVNFLMIKQKKKQNAKRAESRLNPAYKKSKMPATIRQRPKKAAHVS